MSEQEGVTIGLREIYDKVLETHGAVQLYGPRLALVEKTAGEALQIATDADNRSRDTKRHISWMWKAFGTLAGGTILAFVSAWITKHIG